MTHYMTPIQIKKLLRNGTPCQRGRDHYPVVKLETSDGRKAWLLTELDPANPNLAYGLCDLYSGKPALGTINLEEESRLCTKGKARLKTVERFRGRHRISVYAAASRAFRSMNPQAQAPRQIAPAKPAMIDQLQLF